MLFHLLLTFSLRLNNLCGKSPARGFFRCILIYMKREEYNKMKNPTASGSDKHGETDSTASGSDGSKVEEKDSQDSVDERDIEIVPDIQE